MSQLAKLDRNGLVSRYTQITEGDGGQIRPQHTEFFELLVGTSLHQQRNEIAYAAAVEASIGALHYGSDVIQRKSSVLVGEATLDIVDESPLFLRHSAILDRDPNSGQDESCKQFFRKSLEKNTFTAAGLRVKFAQARAADRSAFRPYPIRPATI